MQDELCELRLDIALPDGADARGFERAWRETLASQRLDDAKALSVRFHLCCGDLDSVRASAWTLYLTARLAALPSRPCIAPAPSGAVPSDWRGVRVWLSYRTQDLAALLRKSKTSKKPARRRGCRP